MQAPDRRAERARTRDAALRRLRRLTIASVAGATALAGLFAGVVAKAVPGRRTVTAARTTTVARTTTAAAAPMPAPTPVRSQAPAPAPTPPAQAPVASASPPVVVSGGS